MNLNSLTDTELLKTTKTLIGKERNTMIDFLWHLVEIEERSLHLKQGYSSLFDYLTRGLKLSKSGAGRRITAARCMKENPGLEAMLRNGELNLTTVCEAKQALSEDSAAIKRFSGVSSREAKVIAAEFKPAPKRKIKDSIKPLGRKIEKTQDSLPIFNATPGAGSRDINNLAPAKHEVRFEAGMEFTQKLEEVRAVLSNKLPVGASLEDVLGFCLEACLEKHCPKKKEARRIRRQDSSKTKSKIKKKTKTKTKKNARDRHIPAKLRAEVMRRDQYQCSFVGAKGTKCGCKSNLQIDHIIPFAVGGKNELDNLRVLCQAHNQFAAHEAFGQGVIKNCIQRAKIA